MKTPLDKRKTDRKEPDHMWLDESVEITPEAFDYAISRASASSSSPALHVEQERDLHQRF